MAARRSPHGRRCGRSRRHRPVLLAHCRLLSQDAPLPCARLLLARDPDRLGAGHSPRRLADHPAELAHGFVVVGLAGLPVALLVKRLIPEPVRGGLDEIDGKASLASPPLFAVARILARNPSFWLLSFGAAFGSILGYGLIFWLPSFLNRTFGLDPGEIGCSTASIVLVGGVRRHLARRLGRGPARTGPPRRLCAHPVGLLRHHGAVPRARPFAPSLRSRGCCSRSAR